MGLIKLSILYRQIDLQQISLDPPVFKKKAAG